jgi:hypothetical protein
MSKFTSISLNYMIASRPNVLVANQLILWYCYPVGVSLYARIVQKKIRSAVYLAISILKSTSNDKSHSFFE